MNFIETIENYVHKYFIFLLITVYFTASLFPNIGIEIRSVHIGAISLPILMLSFLLINAGMGINLKSLSNLKSNIKLLMYGLSANIFIPIAFIGLLMFALRLWHNADEVQHILVGLALVASMPIAGSSTAWSQNANGNLALSLGLVLFSTMLSPLTTPIALHSVGFMTNGDYSEDLHELAGSGAGWFLFMTVIIPTALGIFLNIVLGKQRASSGTKKLKLLNFIILLILNYSNAAVSLPQIVINPDWDFLTITISIAFILCFITFLSGWIVSRLCQTNKVDRIALVYGLGMNNNGTGLVLAAIALADHPQVFLPIIIYNLVQYLVAGIVDRVFFYKKA
jgi:BASS family bile acid:Na+ symporter